jgi:hypothetical protein
MSTYKSIFSMVILTGVVVLVMMAGSLIYITSTNVFYSGSIVITSQQQENDLIGIIKSKGSVGMMGAGQPYYEFGTTDNGDRILDYGFYSKDKTLPFKIAK